MRWLEGSGWKQPLLPARKTPLKSCSWIRDVQHGMSMKWKRSQDILFIHRPDTWFVPKYHVCLYSWMALSCDTFCSVHKVTTPFPKQTHPRHGYSSLADVKHHASSPATAVFSNRTKNQPHLYNSLRMKGSM